MQSKPTTTQQQRFDDWNSYCKQRARMRRVMEFRKIILLLSTAFLFLMLLSACGTNPVVIQGPRYSLPEQYKHDYQPLPSAQAILGRPVDNGDDLSVLIKTAVGRYNECSIEYNSLWHRCEAMLEQKP